MDSLNTTNPDIPVTNMAGDILALEPDNTTICSLDQVQFTMKKADTMVQDYYTSPGSPGQGGYNISGSFRLATRHSRFDPQGNPATCLPFDIVLGKANDNTRLKNVYITDIGPDASDHHRPAHTGYVFTGWRYRFVCYDLEYKEEPYHPNEDAWIL